ncbi:transmembrane protein 186-like [Schistocerca gregaria]|uniref:transmembrane protein 186-like n=1 Tax=Schistocerca gregaria TaxID=7010 RepID=UPI00211EFB5E|nr:transmembrane protein 186-like [Schistocerca gregaria]
MGLRSQSANNHVNSEVRVGWRHERFQSSLLLRARSYNLINMLSISDVSRIVVRYGRTKVHFRGLKTMLLNTKCSCDMFRCFGNTINNVDNSASSINTKGASDVYTPFYKFQYVLAARNLSRLKWYQTFCTALSIPTALCLEVAGLVPTDTVKAVFILGAMGTLALHTIGVLGTNVVGALYLNSSESLVKISYLDFYGRRIDTICGKEDIMLLSELADEPSDVYIHLRRYSTSQKLKLTLRFGKILHMDKFVSVFGQIK